ncbi:uncharacterized protein METZ01_LOCUS503907, partial [marine metagenome]
MKKIIRSINLLILCAESIICQQFISADPFNVLKIEQKQFSDSTTVSSLMLRPIIRGRNTSDWRILARSEFYYNNNVPNLENMGNRWIGKGTGFFSSFNISYSNSYISLSIEPYYFFDQNQYVKNPNREYPYNAGPDIFNVLNDNRYFTDQPYVSYGFRES